MWTSFATLGYCLQGRKSPYLGMGDTTTEQAKARVRRPKVSRA